MRSNEEIINLLDAKRKEQNMSLSELARRVGMAKSALSRYFNKTREFPLNKVEVFATALDLPSEYILGFDTKNDSTIETIYNQLNKENQQEVYNFAEHKLEEQNKKIVPLLGQTAANPTELGYCDTIHEETVEYNVPLKADCALIVKGDSMEPIYHDGNIVFYKSQPTVENGEMAIVEVDGDGVTLKRLYFNYEEDKIILRSLNKKYKDRELAPEQVRILGKVVK